MSILRDENDNVIALIKLLATTCMKRTNTRVSLLNTRKIEGTANSLTEAMLSSFYKEQLGEALRGSKETKGFIKIKANSWLNLVDITKFTPAMLQHNILPIEDEVLNKLVDRLGEEVTFYKHITDTDLKVSIANIKRYKDTVAPAKSLTDLFSISVVRIMPTLQLLRDKGLLEVNSLTPMLPSKDLVNSKGLMSVYLTLDTIDNDPELLMSLKGDTSGMDMADIFEDIEEIFTGDIIANIRNIPLREINVLIVLVSILSSLQRKEVPDTSLYNEFNTLIAVMKSSIFNLENRYESRVNNQTLVQSFKVKGEITVLYVIGAVYDKYLETTKTLKPMIGAYLSPLVESSSRDVKNVEMFVTLGLTEILSNRSKFETLADEFNKTLLLTRQNEDINKLRTYFTFGILDGRAIEGRLVNDDKDAINKYISKLNLVELGNTESTTIDIYKKFTYKNSNLKTFLTAMEEADFLLGNKADPKTVAGYAALKLITLYLAGQTTVI